MKKTIYLILFTLAFNTLKATTEPPEFNSTLQSAVLYLSGAELTHRSEVQLPTGNSEIIISGIANNVNVNSIRIKTPEGVTIMSSGFNTDYINTTLSSSVSKLKDSLKLIENQISNINVKINSNAAMLEFLQANKNPGGQQGTSLTELENFLKFYKKETSELLQQQQLLNDKKTELSEKAVLLKKQITDEERSSLKKTGKLTLAISSKSSGKFPVEISYITSSAFWKPYYEIKVQSVSKPIQLVYKAKLNQNTGLNWKSLKLTLNSSTPMEWSATPELQPWFVNYYTPRPTAFNDMLQGKAAGVELQEVVVTAYGNRRTSADEREKALNSSGLDGSIEKIETLTNISYEISLPFDLPSDGKEKIVELKNEMVQSDYRYFAFPGKYQEAFLSADVVDWEKLDLLAGESGIIFEETYLGKTSIDPSQFKDTLNFTLGKDRRVVVKKDKVQDKSRTRTLGSNKEQSISFDINIRNNKPEAIKITVKDQIPVSMQKDIEVTLTESSKADYDKQTGILTWELTLQPGEVKSLNLSYTIKHPKDKMINM